MLSNILKIAINYSNSFGLIHMLIMKHNKQKLMYNILCKFRVHAVTIMKKQEKCENSMVIKI